MVEHGGNLKKYAQLAGCAETEILDFSINLNPDGPPEGLFQVCFRALNELGPYPALHAGEYHSRKRGYTGVTGL